MNYNQKIVICSLIIGNLKIMSKYLSLFFFCFSTLSVTAQSVDATLLVSPFRIKRHILEHYKYNIKSLKSAIEKGDLDNLLGEINVESNYADKESYIYIEYHSKVVNKKTIKNLQFLLDTTYYDAIVKIINIEADNSFICIQAPYQMTSKIPINHTGKKVYLALVQEADTLRITELNIQPFILYRKKRIQNKSIKAFKFDSFKYVEDFEQKALSDTWIPMHFGIRQDLRVEGANPYYITDQTDEPLNALGKKLMLDGNFSMPFFIYRGKSNQSRLWRSMSVYMLPEFNFRIILNSDISSPLLPLNTKVGIGANKFIYNSRNRNLRKQATDRFEKRKKWAEEYSHKKLILGAVEAQVSHYSNGQSDSAFIEMRERVPNFSSGNFSTNYLRLGTNWHIIGQDMSQFSSSLNLRHDLGAAGVAEYDTTQINRYGTWRAEGYVMFKSRLSGFFARFQRSSIQNGGIYAPILWQHSFRIDYEWILDDISNYSLLGNDVPLTVKLRYQADFNRWYNAGIFIDMLVGRDDLNIRYHLKNVAFRAGLTFRFKKNFYSKEVTEAAIDRVLEKRLDRVKKKRSQ